MEQIMFRQYIDDEKMTVYLDDEPQKEGRLDVFPTYTWSGRHRNNTMIWNGEPVTGELIHWKWQKEGEYDLFLYTAYTKH